MTTTSKKKRLTAEELSIAQFREELSIIQSFYGKGAWPLAGMHNEEIMVIMNCNESEADQLRQKEINM